MACAPHIDLDADETADRLASLDGPTVDLDPDAGIIPFPNNLLLGATGTVQLPATCNESSATKAIREQILNTLDGFGTFHPRLSVTFSDRPDFQSLGGHLRLFRLPGATQLGDPVALEEIAVTLVATTSVRWAPDCSSSRLVDTVSLIPREPLAGSSTYAAVVLAGVTTDDRAFVPSHTWSLVRLLDNPVTVEAGEVVAHHTGWDPFSAEGRAALLGIDRLWRAHAPALAALDAGLDVARSDILLAFAFTTQEIPGPLDPSRSHSLAAQIPRSPLLAVDTMLVDPTTGDPITAEVFFQDALGIDAATCAALGCAAVGDVLTGVLPASDYQRQTANPLPGGAPVPGPWDDPVAPTEIREALIPVIAVVPAGPAPAGGFPAVIFGHGLNRSKEDLLALGPALASRGLAAVAIDWVAHGARAVRISADAHRTGYSGYGCDGDLGEPVAIGDHAHCFAPFFAVDLGNTRDNLRQSVLDALALSAALEGCGDDCGPLRIDPDRIGFFGHSLGSLIGAVAVAVSPDIAAAVLNVGGAGLVDLIENTDNLALRCGLVDALISTGVILGEPFDSESGTGTCLDGSWRTQSGWPSFANVARWVLDPADSANFAARLEGRSVLIQEVGGDQVIPNLTTESLARWMGLELEDRRLADIAYVTPPAASRAVTVEPRAGKWVVYEDVAAAGTFVGNTYHHGSLLTPPSACQETVHCDDGMLGTAQMQTDAFTFLTYNLGAQ